MNGKKQKKSEEKGMKSKLQRTGNKRNNINSTCCNNSNISYIRNNKREFINKRWRNNIQSKREHSY